MNKYQFTVLTGIIFIIIGILVFISSIVSFVSNPSGGLDISGGVVVFLGLIIIGIVKALQQRRQTRGFKNDTIDGG